MLVPGVLTVLVPGVLKVLVPGVLTVLVPGVLTVHRSTSAPQHWHHSSTRHHGTWHYGFSVRNLTAFGVPSRRSCWRARVRRR